MKASLAEDERVKLATITYPQHKIYSSVLIVEEYITQTICWEVNSCTKNK